MQQPSRFLVDMVWSHRCSADVQGVHMQLQHVLESRSTDGQAAAATAQMLRALGVSAKSMRASLLAGRTADLKGAFAQAQQRLDSLGLRYEDGQATLASFLSALAADVLPRLSHALAVYTAVFGNPSSVRTPRGGSSPVDGLLQGAAHEFIALVRQACAKHCQLAVLQSAPCCATPDMDLCSHPWAQGSEADMSGVFTGDFGVAALLEALQQLSTDAGQLWDAPEHLNLQEMVERVVWGAIRCASWSETQLMILP